MNFIFFFCIQTENNFVSRLFIPIPAKMTDICQSLKRSCNLFIEPQLTSLLVLYNFPHVLKIFTAYHSI